MLEDVDRQTPALTGADLDFNILYILIYYIYIILYYIYAPFLISWCPSCHSKSFSPSVSIYSFCTLIHVLPIAADHCGYCQGRTLSAASHSRAAVDLQSTAASGTLPVGRLDHATSRKNI